MKLSPLALLAVALGCHNVQEQGDNSFSPDRVIAIHPSDGAMALRGDVPMSIVLGHLAQGTLPEVVVSAGDEEWEPVCKLSDNGVWVDCRPLQDVPDNEEYLITVSVDGSVVQVAATAADPRPGRAWMFTEEAEVEQVGSGSTAADLVETMLNGAGVVGVVADWDGEPGDRVFLVGLASYRDDGAVSIREPGLTLAVEIEVAPDLRFRSKMGDVILPLSIEGEVVPALIEDCTITGAFDAEGMTEFSLEGYFPASTMVRIADAMGPMGDLVVETVELDVDTNDDGEMDGASVMFNSSATDVELVAWTF